MIKMLLVCRYSIDAQVFFVRGPPYNGRDIEASLQRHVHVWKRWRGTFLPDMDGRLIAGLVLHRRSCSSSVLAIYFIHFMIVIRLLSHYLLFLAWIAAVCILYAEAGCNT